VTGAVPSEQTERIGFKPNKNFKTAGQSQQWHRLKSGYGGGGKMQTRQAQTDLTAYTTKLNKVTIPAKAVLHDFRQGPGHEGLAPHNPDVASFHYDDQVYFNIAQEIVGKTVIVMRTGSVPTGD
jgi:hypothetical protein